MVLASFDRNSAGLEHKSLEHKSAIILRKNKAPGFTRLRVILITVDAIALMTGWVVFANCSRDWQPMSLRANLSLLVIAAFTTASCIVFAAYRGLYLPRICSIKEQERSRLIGVAIASGAAADLALRLIDPHPDLRALLLQSVCMWALLIVGRSGYHSWLNGRRRHGFFTQPTILVGANEEARHWSVVIADHPELGIEVRGVISDIEPDLVAIKAPWFGPPSEVVAAARAVNAKSVIVMGHMQFSSTALRTLARELAPTGLDVQFSMGISGIAEDRFTKTTLAHENLLYLEHPSALMRSALLKRTLDVIVSATALIVTSPLLIAAALAVRIEDGGPVFFHQSRVGRDGRCFQLHKLRSMVPNADSLKAELAADNVRGGPLFKAVGDPRITRVGRILRTTSIDELPQLWNVLRGDMSMVGPRPALPEEVAQFGAELLARHKVLPGITGLWQIEGRDAGSFGSYEHLDLHYVENWSVFLDMTIMCQTAASLSGRTVRALLKRDSADIAA